MASFICDKRGVYALIVYLASDHRIRVGKMGSHNFKRGYYIYVGSALGPGGLNARVKHHAKKTAHPHWHIDYLRSVTRIKAVWYSKTETLMEHHWAAAVEKMPRAQIPVKGFGSSDCRCISHLFYVSRKPGIRSFIKNLQNLTKNESKCRVHLFSDF